MWPYVIGKVSKRIFLISYFINPISGKFGLLSLGKASCNKGRATHPYVHAGYVSVAGTHPGTRVSVGIF